MTLVKEAQFIELALFLILMFEKSVRMSSFKINKYTLH